MIFRYDLTVPSSAIDGNGHVNNLRYIEWMIEAAKRHAESKGATALAQAAGGTWIVRSHHIEYLRPAFEDERVAILTWIHDLRRVSSKRRYRFVRLADGALLAQGETQWVFMTTGGRLRSIPEDVASRFNVLPAEEEKAALEQALAN